MFNVESTMNMNVVSVTSESVTYIMIIHKG